MSQKGFLNIAVLMGLVATFLTAIVFIFIFNLNYHFLGNCPKVDDTIPMFGGVNKCWSQKLNDEIFIIDATNAKPFVESSRLRASRKLLRTSEDFRDKGDYAASTKLLNQAWLLSPQDPLIFSDFGALYAEQKDFDKSFEMFEKGLQIKTATDDELSGVLCTYGLVYIKRIAFEGKSETDPARLEYISNADQLLTKGVKLSPKNAFCHGVWAFVLSAQDKFPEAWKEVKIAKQLGYQFPPLFIEALSSKMPDPEN